MNSSDYARAYRAVYERESKPNREKSFAQFRQNAIAMRKALQMLEKIYEDDRAKILEEFSTSKASTMLAELQSKYEAARMQAVEDLKASLDGVIRSKRDAIQRSCKAPSTDDVNLLAVLNMRQKLTENDIIHAAEAVGNNLVSLGAIADIAKRHQIYLPIPTAQGFEEQLEEAEQYSLDMLRQVLTPDKSLDYKGTEFYRFPDSDGFANMFYHDLDNSVYSTEQKGEQLKIDLAAVKEVIRAKHTEKSSGANGEAKNDSQG